VPTRIGKIQGNTQVVVFIFDSGQVSAEVNGRFETSSAVGLDWDSGGFSSFSFGFAGTVKLSFGVGYMCYCPIASNVLNKTTVTKTNKIPSLFIFISLKYVHTPSFLVPQTNFRYNPNISICGSISVLPCKSNKKSFLWIFLHAAPWEKARSAH